MAIVVAEAIEDSGQKIISKETTMNKFIIYGVIFVLVALTFWYLSKSNKKQHFQSVDNMMQYLAGEAVKMAKERHGIVLNYSEESIKDVEKILGTVHEEYRASHSEAGVQGLAMCPISRPLDPAESEE